MPRTTPVRPLNDRDRVKVSPVRTSQAAILRRRPSGQEERGLRLSCSRTKARSMRVWDYLSARSGNAVKVSGSAADPGAVSPPLASSTTTSPREPPPATADMRWRVPAMTRVRHAEGSWHLRHVA